MLITDWWPRLPSGCSAPSSRSSSGRRRTAAHERAGQASRACLPRHERTPLASRPGGGGGEPALASAREGGREAMT
eukprot:7685762-Heterocapsa_arctica.AAC.1